MARGGGKMTRSISRKNRAAFKQTDPSMLHADIDWNFDAPNTIGDLDSMLEQPSAATLASENMWFQTHHPSHFTLNRQRHDTNSRVLVSPEKQAAKALGRTRHRSGSPSQKRRVISAGKENSVNTEATWVSKKDGGALKRIPRGKEDVEVAQKRGGGAGVKKLGSEGDEDRDQHDQRVGKRRRTGAGALAQTSSSSARAEAVSSNGAAAFSAQEDVMKKRLQEFRKQKQSTECGNRRHTAAAKSKASASSSVDSTCRTVASSTRAKAVHKKATAQLQTATIDHVTTKKLNDILMAPRTETINNKKLDDILKSAVSSTDLKRPTDPDLSAAADSAFTPPSIFIPPPGRLGTVSTQRSGSETTSTSRSRSTVETVDAPAKHVVSTRTVKKPVMASIPVTTVKRAVGGGTVANTSVMTQRRGRRGGGQVAAREAGVGIKAPSTRNRVLGGGNNILVSPRRATVGSGRHDPRRRSAAAVAAAVAELGLDSELKARLAAHNKVVNKGKCKYEPAKSVRDYRRWEKETGKKYRDLTMDERGDANREIDIMLGRPVQE